MRPLKLSLAVAAMLAAALASCKKDVVSPSAANYVSLNFDSMNYRTTNLQTNYSSGFLSIMGIFNSDTMISIVIQKPVAGSFDISSGAASATFSAGSSNQFMSNNGSVNVTSIAGDTLRGTFRLHCVEIASGQTCELIDGAFEVVER